MKLLNIHSFYASLDVEIFENLLNKFLSTQRNTYRITRRSRKSCTFFSCECPLWIYFDSRVECVAETKSGKIDFGFCLDDLRTIYSAYSDAKFEFCSDT